MYKNFDSDKNNTPIYYKFKIFLQIKILFKNCICTELARQLHKRK